MAFRKLVGSYKDYDLSTHVIEDGYLCVDVSDGTLKIGNGTTAGGTSVGGSGGGGVTVQDEGGALSTTGTILNFVGSGVVATGTGATKTITIAGGSASSLGDLSAIGSTLTAPSNADLTFAVAGSGNVVLTGITFPNSDGSNTQVLATNGSGVLSFADPVSTSNIDGGTASATFDSSLTTIDGGTAA